MNTAAQLTDRQSIDMLWVIVASGMVFFMQLGFLCLEIGLVQAKNAIDTAVKKINRFVLTSFGFFVIGFCPMFWDSWGGGVGERHFLLFRARRGGAVLGNAVIFMMRSVTRC